MSSPHLVMARLLPTCQDAGCAVQAIPAETGLAERHVQHDQHCKGDSDGNCAAEKTLGTTGSQRQPLAFGHHLRRHSCTCVRLQS